MQRPPEYFEDPQSLAKNPENLQRLRIVSKDSTQLVKTTGGFERSHTACKDPQSLAKTVGTLKRPQKAFKESQSLAKTLPCFQRHQQACKDPQSLVKTLLEFQRLQKAWKDPSLLPTDPSKTRTSVAASKSPWEISPCLQPSHPPLFLPQPRIFPALMLLQGPTVVYQAQARATQEKPRAARNTPADLKNLN